MRSSRPYLSSLCAVVGRGGEQLPAFLLHVAGASFGEGVGPQIGYAIAWDGEEVARVGEGEEGGLVGSAEPGDPSLAGGPVLPMKLRVIWSGICLLSLCSSFYSICHSLRPPRLRSADGLARAGTSNILTH